MRDDGPREDVGDHRNSMKCKYMPFYGSLP